MCCVICFDRLLQHAEKRPIYAIVLPVRKLNSEKPNYFDQKFNIMRGMRHTKTSFPLQLSFGYRTQFKFFPIKVNGLKDCCHPESAF